MRELENAMERAVALTSGSRIDVDDLTPEVRGAAADLSGPPPEIVPLEAMERRYILSVLRQNERNRSKTARDLGIASATLWRKLAEYERMQPGSVPRAPAAPRR